MAEEARLGELGELVRARREELRIGRRKAADAGGMSPTTWEKIEKGGTVYGMTYGGVEVALGWPQGSIRGYLDGGDPPQPAAEGEEEIDEGPPLRRASLAQMLDEIARRDAELRSELAHRLYPALAATDREETAESVRARGNIPGRRIGTGESDGSASGGGQS